MAFGWTLDPDAAAESIEVLFYVDGPAGTGRFAGAARANQPRPDVNQVTGYPGDHGFNWRIGEEFRDGVSHSLWVYGVDRAGQGGEVELLSGAPKQFRLSPGGVTRDGHASLSYDEASNRISVAGWEYDAAGNQTRIQTASGGWQRLEARCSGQTNKGQGRWWGGVG